MTQRDPTSAPRSIGDMPHPYAVCVSCGATPALTGIPPVGERLCPACARRNLLEQAVAAHLRALAAPILGAWGNFWAAAGVPHAALLGVLEWEGGGYMKFEAAARFRRGALAVTRRKHRAEPYQGHRPERHTLTATQLPEILHMLPADPECGRLRPSFEQQDPATGERRQYQPGPGQDLLTLTLADGSAALIPLGMGGRLNLGRGGAVRVPAPLLPAVLAEWRSREQHAEGEA